MHPPPPSGGKQFAAFPKTDRCAVDVTQFQNGLPRHRESIIGCTRCDGFNSISDLHHRVIAGDQTALEDVVRRLIPFLRRRLRGAFHHGSDDLIDDAVQDSVIQYAFRPTVFDPSRGVSLERFLYLVSWRNMADSLAAEARRRIREAKYAECVARQYSAREFGETEFSIDHATRRILEAADGDGERQALLRWLDGERRTAPLASALGLTALSLLDQRREVKRFKDRVLKRIARLTPRIV